VHPLRPAETPQAEWAYTADVEIGTRRDMGHGPLGQRWKIDILGGVVDGPKLQGRVLPGGADRQLWRSDGVRELDALYEIEALDGAVITVHNRVLIQDADAASGRPRYARSSLRFAAPQGPHAWLNQRQFVGTLEPLMPARQAVRVGVFVLM
jgi:Protein of unknown function (DUF3237)